MAIQYPPPKSESFLLSGTGSLTLTDEQREARSLNISIEKVRDPGAVEYFNFRIPEPAAFWGYVQLVQRDFVSEVRPLSFRREVLLRRSEFIPDALEQVTCLIKGSTEFLFSQIADLLLASTDATSESLDQALEIYRANYRQVKIAPREECTALWYEIVPLFAAQVTITWGEYPVVCSEAIPLDLAPNAPAPGKKDGQDDGGGERPRNPPPPERSRDPLNDSPVPPSGTPLSPVPPPATPPPPGPTVPYSVVVNVRKCGRLNSFSPWIYTDSTQTLSVPSGPVVVEVSAGSDARYQNISLVGPDGVRTGVIGNGSVGSQCGGPEYVVSILSQAPA